MLANDPISTYPQRAVRRGWHTALLVVSIVAVLVGAGLTLTSGASLWLTLVLLAIVVIGLAGLDWLRWGIAAGLAAGFGILGIWSGGHSAGDALGWLALLVLALLVSAAAQVTNQRTVRTIAYLEARADHHAMHDELTGLLNRKGVDVVGGGLVRLARRDGEAVCAAIVCVEDDSLQMSAEDRDDAFLTAAEVTAAVFRGSDVLARVSSNCLLVVAKGGGLMAQTVQSRIDEELAKRAILGDITPSVTVGAALLAPWDEGELPELFEQARRDLVMRWSARQQLLRSVTEATRFLESEQPIARAPLEGAPERGYEDGAF